MTQYERDFERVSATVRKEVIRFEVLMFIPCCIHFSYWTAENVCYCSLMKCFCLIIQKEKAKNFKRQIIKYLESLLQSQQQVSVSLCQMWNQIVFLWNQSVHIYNGFYVEKGFVNYSSSCFDSVTETYFCLKVYCLLVVHVLHYRPLAGDLIQKAFMSAAVQ